jgi:hypothetical protein
MMLGAPNRTEAIVPDLPLCKEPNSPEVDEISAFNPDRDLEETLPLSPSVFQ